MGCDIHGWVEKKWRGKWVGVRQFNDAADARNYQRFAELAGVRGAGPEPKGLPDDISDSAAADSEGWGVDGHSHSWLTLKEAAPIFLRTMRIGDDTSDYPREYLYAHFFDVYAYEPESIDDYRIVFWFDN